MGPLYALFSRSLMNAQGEFVGLANFAAYISSGGITTAAYLSRFGWRRLSIGRRDFLQFYGCFTLSHALNYRAAICCVFC
ncbi:hypothetical protein ACT691_03925 [Vibrio metschnikovii]